MAPNWMTVRELVAKYPSGPWGVPLLPASTPPDERGCNVVVPYEEVGGELVALLRWASLGGLQECVGSLGREAYHTIAQSISETHARVCACVRVCARVCACVRVCACGSGLVGGSGCGVPSEANLGAMSMQPRCWILSSACC